MLRSMHAKVPEFHHPNKLKVSRRGAGSFTDWPGIRGDHEISVEGNHLGIIAVAWAYILSARWIEIQETKPEQPNQKKPHRYYLDPQAGWRYDSHDSPDHIDMSQGNHVSLACHATALPNRKRASALKLRRHGFRRRPFSSHTT